MNYWNETPLFRFLLFFIGGILLAVYFPIPGLRYTVALVSVILASQFFLYLRRKKTNAWKRRWIAGALGYLTAFLAGCILTTITAEKNSPLHFRNFRNATGYIGYLTEPPEEKTKSYKTVIRIICVKDNGEWKYSSGNCLVYIPVDSISEALQYGDVILFSEHPQEVQPPANPSQFDYKRWLGFNKIFDRIFLTSGKWKVAGHGYGSRLASFSYDLRDRLLKIFKDNYITGQDYAVLSALILGYEGDIDQEVITAYSTAGVLHVLSVSGLHVGIIYIAINFFLSFLNRRRETRLVKAVIIILFLWFYALLTGLSPSVLRSATMLSFIIIGQMTRQHTNLYNTLSASAFFLLALDPFLVMQVGFQLSYLAVLGIILLQPQIQNWFAPKQWLLSQVWSIISVSLAAQAATFPLGLLYFHQFPVYFLISNMVVIPVSTVVIYGGIFLLIVSPWHFGAALSGILVGDIVHVMNALVMLLEKLPFAQVSGISISVFETWMLYAAAGAATFFSISKNQNFLIAFFISVLLILSSQVCEAFQLARQKEFIVYSVKGKSMLNIIDGKENYNWADAATLNDRNLMQFNVYGHWWDCGLNENNKTWMCDSNQTAGKVVTYKNFILYRDRKILIVRNPELMKHSARLKVDVLILSGNVRISLRQLIRRFRFSFLVIDSSNTASRAKRWTEEAKLLGIRVHSILNEGAFVWNLSLD